MSKYDKMNVRDIVFTCLGELSRNNMFYGHIMQQLDKIFIEEKKKEQKKDENYVVGDKSHRKSEFQTFAVGKMRDEIVMKLFVNEAFVREDIFEKNNDDAKSINQIIGILEHEIMHICFGHLNTSFPDKERGAVAVDLAVNSYIEENRLPEFCVYPHKYGLDPKLSAMEYYNLLRDNKKFQDRSKGGEHDLLVDSHGFWEETAQDELIKNQIKDIIRVARDFSNKNYGSTPGEIVQVIEDMFKFKKPVVPWNRELRLFVGSCQGDDVEFTIQRKSRWFGTVPGIKFNEHLNLAFAIDTSGSMSDSELKRVWNEINSIHKNGASVTVIECDAGIGRIYPFNGKWDGKVTGRGGTDVEPPLKWVDEQRNFDGIIYYTDFYAPVIEKKYRTPSLWLISSNGMDIEGDAIKPYIYGKRYVKMPNVDE